MENADNFLVNALLGMSSSEAIEAGEKRGQQAAIASQRLPKNARGHWPVLESWGVIRTADIDDLFCDAILPNGWRVRATDHSMWNELIDQRGLVRSTYFYKASFYDRDAFMNVIDRRFVGGDVSWKYPQDKVFKAPVIKDLGRNVVIETLPLMNYAVDVNNGLGVVFDGMFCCCAMGDYSNAMFNLQIQRPSSVRVISNREFYDNWHHKGDGEFPTIYAADRLAKDEVERMLRKYPCDFSQWSEDHDYSECELEPLVS